MEYNKDTTPDGTVYERHEGTPEEIARLVMLLPQELKGGELGEGVEISGLIYDTDDAVKFIMAKFRGVGIYESRKVIETVLEYEEDYMRTIGIISE